MAINFRKFLDGIRIIPKTTSTASEKGDLEVDNATGKLNYHNGTSPSPVVTEAHSATLTNKTLDSPTIIGTPSISIPLVINANSASDALRVTQTGSGAALRVEDAANPDSTPFVVDASGSVGIGTASPNAKLQVIGDGLFGLDSNRVRLNSSAAVGILEFNSTAGAIRSNAASSSLVFETNGANERLRIDSSGRLLINTTTARTIGSSRQGQLQLEIANTGSNLAASFVTNGNDSVGTVISLGKSRGTSIGGIAAVQSGDTLGTFRFAGADGTDLSPVSAEIYGQVDGTVATGSVPGRILFTTTSVGSTTPTERMRIDSSGRVLINTAERTNAASSSSLLQLESTGSSSSAAFIRNSNDTSGSVIVVGKSRGTSTGSFTAVTSGDAIGQISFQGTDGTALVGGAAIQGSVDGAVSSGIVPGRIAFSTRDSGGTLAERLRIDSSGRVLVGTTSTNTIAGSAGRIQVAGTTGDTSTITQSRWNAGGNPAYFVMGASRGASVGTQGLVSNNDEVARIQFAASDGAAMQSIGYIAAVVDGVAALNDTPGRLVFRTTPAGSVTPLERLRIDSSGNVGIGVTSPTRRLEVGGTASGNNNVIVVGPPSAATGFSGQIWFRDDSATSRWAVGIPAQTSATSLWITDIVNAPGVARVAIDSTGNVGIGTSGPGAPLDVRGADLDGNQTVAIFRHRNTAGTDSHELRISTDPGANLVDLQSTGSNAGGFRFVIGNTESLRIDSNGNVGVGGITTLRANVDTYTPRFQVEGTTTNSSAISVIRNSANASGSYLFLGKSRNAAIGGNTAVANNDTISRIDSVGNDGTNFILASSIETDVDGTVSAGVVPGRILFRTANSTGTITERLRIDSSGRVLIGTTAATNNIRNSAKLGVVSVGGVNGDQGGAQLTHYSAGNSSLAPILDFATSNGASDGSMTAVGAAQFLGQVAFRGSDGTNFNTACIVRAESDGTVSSGVVPGRLSIHTANSAGTSTERLRIDSAGNVGIGGVPTTKLEVFGSSGNVQIATTGNRVTYTRNGANYLTASGASAIIAYECDNHQFHNGAGTTERMRIDSTGNVGIGTASPHTRLHTNGPIATAVTSNGATSYNILSTDSTVLLTATTGTITATLPTAVGITGRQYTIKRTGTGAASYTVNTTSSQTIDGATTYTLSAQYATVTVQSDGANWVIISKF